MNIQTSAVFNGDVIPQNGGLFTADNRVFQYGDGLFETIRYEKGQLWFFSDHVERLRAGMMALKMLPNPVFTKQELQIQVLDLIARNQLSAEPVRVKIQVWRRPGGLYTPATNEVDYLITVKPGQPFAVTEKTNLGIYPDFRLSPSPVSAYKTCNALPYVLAGLYRQEHGFDDVMLLDTHGHLAECMASNLFWFVGETLFTPSLETGCLGGVLRRQLLRHFPAQEGLFFPDTLEKADCLFCGNVAGIQVYRGLNSPWVTGLERIFAA
ncbi:aminotransferase class IV [Tellurirhabdus rosea]|uniref:aminotransferase class IV n=1 Tax=Tellurirhabdus rosea TaxID=2674997 RepID=UPI00224FDB78|nr:aminotransferase class IV [Tellurirhabdus rosea]